MKTQKLTSAHNNLLLLLLSICSIHASAQYSKLTVDATLGTNYTFCAVQSNPGIGATISLHYTPTRLISFSADLSAGLLWGDGTAEVKKYSESSNSIESSHQSYNFNTEFYSWTGKGYLNIYKLINARKAPRKVIPYLYYGAGFLRAQSESSGNDNSYYQMIHKTYYTSLVGLQLRIKGSRKLDYLLAVQQNFTQTTFLDALPFEQQYESFLSVSAGISYSFSSTRRSSFIDWSKKLVCKQAMY